jgi:hypothetical protein
MNFYNFPRAAARPVHLTRLWLPGITLALSFLLPVFLRGEHISPDDRALRAASGIRPWESLSNEFLKGHTANRADQRQVRNLGQWLLQDYEPSHARLPVPRPADVRRFLKAEQSLTGYANAVAGSRAMPHLGVGIYRDAAPIFTSEHGLGPRSLRPIASVTKTFTATAVLQLIEARKIRGLDDPIGKYLPALNLARAPLGGKAVTIRDFLQQTSGIPYGTSRAGQSVASPVRGHSYYIAPQYRPAGESFAYSNHNYYVLALLIETLSGQSYPEYIRTQILQPAGMLDSTVSPQAAGASGINSTIQDLALFAAALYNTEHPTRLLRQSSVDAMLAVPDYVQQSPDMMYYGLGVRVQYYRGEVAEVYHTGIWTGMFAEFRYFPTHSAVLVHLGNPPDFRARGVNAYRASSVRLAADYVRLLDELLDGAAVPALSGDSADAAVLSDPL